MLARLLAYALTALPRNACGTSHLPHAFDGDRCMLVGLQVWVGSVGVSPAPASVRINAAYKNQDSIAFQDGLGETLLSLCRTIPHGVLCFFPSYTLMDKVLSRWQTSGLLLRLQREKHLVVEPRGGGAEALEKAMSEFYQAVVRSKKRASKDDSQDKAGAGQHARGKRGDSVPKEGTGGRRKAGADKESGRMSLKGGESRPKSVQEGFELLFGKKAQELVPSGAVKGGRGCGGGAEHAGTRADAEEREEAQGREGGGGALFLAVCRGKVSEGLDFADDNARGVIVVGVPFPNAMDSQVKLKKAYNSDLSVSRGLLGGEEWYTLQAFRAVMPLLCMRCGMDVEYWDKRT